MPMIKAYLNAGGQTVAVDPNGSWKVYNPGTGKFGAFAKGPEILVPEAAPSGTDPGAAALRLAPAPQAPAPHAEVPKPNLDNVLLSIGNQLNNLQTGISSIQEKMGQPDKKVDELIAQIEKLKGEVSSVGQGVSFLAQKHEECDKFPLLMEQVTEELRLLEELKTSIQNLSAKPSAPSPADAEAKPAVTPEPAKTQVPNIPVPPASPGRGRRILRVLVGAAAVLGIIAALYSLNPMFRSWLNFDQQTADQNVPLPAPPQQTVTADVTPDSPCDLTGTVFLKSLGRCVYPK